MTSDIVQKARKLFKKDVDAWRDAYDKAREDLLFLSDDPYAQWDEKDFRDRERTGRPALTIDQLGQFVHQVSNQIRMNTPTINIIPAGRESSIEVADAYKGLIKAIEYKSSADDAYDTAVNFSVKSSLGFIRVDHDYADEDGFDQELLIRRVNNPFACFLDSDSVEADGRDAKHAFVVDKMTVDDFKKQYSGFDPISFDAKDTQQQANLKDTDYIMIAEFFIIEETTKEIFAYDDGVSEEKRSDAKPVNSRKIKNRLVKRYKLSGSEILEETTFPGKYIPIVPVYGEEAWIEGKRHIFSLIRKSKGAQRMYNYWKSLETELLMKQPQAPVMAAEGQTEDYADDWKNPNKTAVLRYKQTDAEGNPAPKPERLPPPTIPTGIVNAARETVDDIKATMGMYHASIGQQGNETSGIAISRRKQEGEVATYHFGDNLVRSITHVGRILVCAIPEIYDTPRLLQIIGEEESSEQIGVNGAMADGQEEVIDLKKGKYDVRVTTGSSFTTMRQEAAEFYTQIITQQPDLMKVAGDLLFKSMDFPGAQALAERMKKIIPPELVAGEDGKEEADPEKIKLAQMVEQSQQVIGELQVQAAELQQKLDSKEAEIQIKAQSESDKAQNDRMKIELEVLKLKMEEEKNKIDAALKEHELLIKIKELEIKQMENNGRTMMQAAEIAIQGQSPDNDVGASMGNP